MYKRPVDDKASTGVLSFITNCTSIARLSSEDIIVDRDVFKINNGNLKISSFTFQMKEHQKICLVVTHIFLR